MSRMFNLPSRDLPEAKPASRSHLSPPRAGHFPVELEAEFAEMQATRREDHSLVALLSAGIGFHALLIAEKVMLHLPPSVFALRGILFTLLLLACLLLPSAWKKRGRGRAALALLGPVMVLALLVQIPLHGAHQLLPLQTGIAALLVLFGVLAQLPRSWAFCLAFFSFAADAVALFTGPVVHGGGGIALAVESLWAPAFACVGLVCLASMQHREAQREFLLLRHAVFAEPDTRGVTLEHTRHLDPDTGIANRLAFDMRYRAAWDHAASRRNSIALLFFWVDNLQDYKRDLGFRFVELLQSQLAGLLKDSLRRADDMVARFDHQHFVVMLPGVGTDGATQIAERLRGCVEEMPVYAGQQRQKVSVTVGAASLRAKRTIPRERLLDAAVHALDQARSTGTNVVCVEGRGCIPRMN